MIDNNINNHRILKKIIFFLACFIFGKIIITQSNATTPQHPLKILFAVSTFPKPSETFILNQITGLIDRGHDIHIFAHKKGSQNSFEQLLPYQLEQKTYCKEIPIDLNYFDAIVCQFGTLGQQFAEVKKHGFTGKLACFFRGYDISSYLRQNPNAYDELLNVGDLFLPICSYFKSRLETLGCDPKKITVHHSALDLNQFTYKPRSLAKDNTSIKIITTGRFVEKKGIEYAIRAIAQLIPQYPNIEYTLIGQGPLKQTYQTIIKNLSLEKNVKILGWHTHEQLAKKLAESHIFILPSVTAENGDQEGIPNTLKEAMAMGLPVISTYHSGTAELLNDKVSGLLVPERDSNAIAQQIDYLISHPESWQHMCAIARKIIECEYDIEKENNKLEKNLYRLTQKEYNHESF